MKRIFALLLVFAMLTAALAGCAGKQTSEGKTSGGADNTQAEDPASQEETPDDAATETAGQGDRKVRMVYFEPGYMVLSLNGDFLAFGFQQSDGEDLEPDEESESDHWMVQGGISRENLRLITVAGFSKKYAAEDIAFYAEEQTESGEEDNLYTDLWEPMTDEEWEAIGCIDLDGHCCYFETDTSYDDNYFMAISQFAFIKDNGKTFHNSGITLDNFALFAGDGTPLDTYFDGYTWHPLLMSDRSLVNELWFRFEGGKDRETNKEKLEELIACEPYIVFTGSDGSQQQIDLNLSSVE